MYEHKKMRYTHLGLLFCDLWFPCYGRYPIIVLNSLLTHWGRVIHTCVGRLTIIGSDNGLPPTRRQAIICTNAGILLIGPLGLNFSEILIEIQTFSFKRMHFKRSSAKWRPFCFGLNALKHISNISRVQCFLALSHRYILKFCFLYFIISFLLVVLLLLLSLFLYCLFLMQIDIKTKANCDFKSAYFCYYWHLCYFVFQTNLTKKSLYSLHYTHYMT